MHALPLHLFYAVAMKKQGKSCSLLLGTWQLLHLCIASGIPGAAQWLWAPAAWLLTTSCGLQPKRDLQLRGQQRQRICSISGAQCGVGQHAVCVLSTPTWRHCRSGMPPCI